jgi:hypothetical protein
VFTHYIQTYPDISRHIQTYPTSGYLDIRISNLWISGYPDDVRTYPDISSAISAALRASVYMFAHDQSEQSYRARIEPE